MSTVNRPRTKIKELDPAQWIGARTKLLDQDQVQDLEPKRMAIMRRRRPRNQKIENGDDLIADDQGRGHCLGRDRDPDPLGIDRVIRRTVDHLVIDHGRHRTVDIRGGDHVRGLMIEVDPESGGSGR